MAFSSTIEKKAVMGDLRVYTGTFTNTGGSTGGNITTSLSRVLHMTLTPTGAAVSADAAAVNETMPFSGGDVTVVTTADVDGTWVAFGW